MKNILLVLFAAIAVFLSSCTSQSGRKNQERNELFQKVVDLKVDSCQYDMDGNIVYFAHGEVAVKRCKSDAFIVVTLDDVDTIDSRPLIQSMVDVLVEKCAIPESYQSASLKKFKQVIGQQPLDSSRVDKLKSGDYYDFYSRSYKILITVEGFVPFESKGKTTILTRDINGEYCLQFCSTSTKWSTEQQQEILKLLLAKREKGTTESPKKEIKIIPFGN